jgi:hypothetical protein
MLAVFEVAEAEDLSRAMSRLFAAGSPWREKMVQEKVYVRYAIAPSIADRRTAATALKNWLSTQREVASQVFESRPPMAAEQKPTVAIEQKPVLAMAAVAEPQAIGLKTVAERAVDRVTHGINLSKAVSAGS